MAVYDKAIQSAVVLIALFVSLASSTIEVLLSAIGIAGVGSNGDRGDSGLPPTFAVSVAISRHFLDLLPGGCHARRSALPRPTSRAKFSYENLRHR
jgi:hypothetical protein